MIKTILFWSGVFIMCLVVMSGRANATGIITPDRLYCATYMTGDTCATPDTTMLAACKRTDPGFNGTSSPVPPAACLLNGVNFGVAVDYAPLVCPSNSTVASSTTCACNGTYTPSGDGKSCVAAPVCAPAGSPVSAGYYDVGTTPDGVTGTGAPAITACAGGCEAVYSGSSVSKRALVGGVYHYFAQGAYTSNGGPCSSGAGGSLNNSTATSSTDGSCAAGQQMIQMNGVTRCWVSNAAGEPATAADPNSAAAKAAAAASTAAAAAAASAAASSVAGTVAGQVAAGTVYAGATSGGGSSGSPSTGYAPDDPMNAFCIKNPTSPICKAATAGRTTVTTGAVSGLYTAGALTNKTFSSVVSDFKSRFTASAFGVASVGFFNVNLAAGACPTWTQNVPMLGVMTFDLFCGATFQQLLPWMRALILIIFSVVAFRIAIL